jgi:uncharacterized protein
MADVVARVGDALLMAFGMFGFGISAVLQVFVSKERIAAALGRDGPREIALATVAGAASSDCSYAAAAVMRTLFKRGAALTPSLAFLLASTNLVAELGLMLFLLMGWEFTVGEWIGGVVLIAVMAVLVRITYPATLVEAARHHPEPHRGQNHDHATAASPALVRVAQAFAMDWGMLWKDLVLGFVIAGALAEFIPHGVWQALFVEGANPWLQVPANALLGPLVAVLSFVCSIGNVPMAAVLWGSGVSFGGVLAFLYADLIVLPLLDVYRRYFGWKMAAYIAAVFYATMVVAALIMDVVFNAIGLVPMRHIDIHATMTAFSFNYTFWLNVVFGAIALVLFALARRRPAPDRHAHHAHTHQGHGHGHEHHHHHH